MAEQTGIRHKETIGEGSVSFKCPECGKSTIRRSKHQRQIASKYICPMCSFEGPN